MLSVEVSNLFQKYLQTLDKLQPRSSALADNANHITVQICFGP